MSPLCSEVYSHAQMLRRKYGGLIQLGAANTFSKDNNKYLSDEKPRNIV